MTKMMIIDNPDKKLKRIEFYWKSKKDRVLNLIEWYDDIVLSKYM